MSNDVVISVENLSKRYRIGAKEESYKTFREAIIDGFTAPIRNLRRLRKLTKFDETGSKEPNSPLHAPGSMRRTPAPVSKPLTLCSMLPAPSRRLPNDTIWALKDVSFEVKQGEVVGIIGRNGAGKTTLLKILSRITEPTAGDVKLYGRVSSLLEVGTGFHPELTGRENIYLNGAILGMRKEEINRKFDEIVGFAEIEKFLGTPVKRYSSGMYVRLAFAVAAHLEPEILLVDEVLAVGDTQFQKKCLGKMEEVAEGGKTVLFVSHNMEAISKLCQRTILISKGSVILDDNTPDTISYYLLDGRENSQHVRVYDDATAPGDNFVKLRAVRLTDHVGNEINTLNINEGCLVEIEYVVLESISNFHLYIRIFTQDGSIAFGSGDWDGEYMHKQYTYSPGRYRSQCFIPGDMLNSGSYSLTIMGMIPDVRYLFSESNVLIWEISEIGGAGGPTSNRRPGVIRPRLKWKISSLEDTCTML